MAHCSQEYDTHNANIRLAETKKHMDLLESLIEYTEGNQERLQIKFKSIQLNFETWGRNESTQTEQINKE